MSPRRPTSREGGASQVPTRRRLSKKNLEALVEEATVDCHGESEQATGLFTMIEEHLSIPFQATVLGVEVMVEKIDITERDDVIVRCRRGADRQWLRLVDVPPPHPTPAGWEWVEAYRHWAGGGR